MSSSCDLVTRWCSVVGLSSPKIPILKGYELLEAVLEIERFDVMETCVKFGPGVPGLQFGIRFGVGCGIGVGFGDSVGRGAAYDHSRSYCNIGKPSLFFSTVAIVAPPWRIHNDDTTTNNK
ncbi:PREDICTED: uncharacterized protein LOC104787285 [Camelina sativa]|uniref:Uncharacterized protein LOC104787285 n=1 Tax=Camelina sativa TaxID=90675 RepID=A0ABM0Z6J1_CAMSA|nr:PREDICTED: uncharacterized protein LOC104787285 [Camelina sativa]